ncbi:helix-turn-helix domain-containing protein [Streptomyces cahuitamycinicus]|uniref:helix-turn-helix domain-containing protein n=1 Tax=Streptomyces cahuitamycinicus TaxID=2070367 RepID=UPI001FE984A7|nr:helix-turn-helix transcriptional regulator [Streptomyces cahuitamycinicus]
MSKEPPATSSDTHERSEYVYRLNVAKLLEKTAAHGDTTGWKIYRRTGISESSVYRYLKGEAQPDLNSAMRLSEAYDLDIREVMERVQIEAAA